jgi:uncharacterized protein YjdB
MLPIALLAAAACGDDDDGVSPTTTDLAIDAPAALAVRQDSSVEIGAVLIDQARNNVEVTNAALNYSIPAADSTIAQIVDGQIRGVRGGTTTLTITFEDRNDNRTLTATVPVTVTAHPAGAATLEPPAVTLFTGEDSTLVAFVRGAAADDTLYCNTCSETVIRGNVETDRVFRDVVFESRDEDVATVDEGGVVTAVAPGTTWIVLSVPTDPAIKDSTQVTVIDRPVNTVVVTPNPGAVGVGQTLQMMATLIAANGDTLTGRTVLWSSDTPAFATVDPTTGVVTGVLAGTTAVIRATSETKTGTAQVLVNP